MPSDLVMALGALSFLLLAMAGTTPRHARRMAVVAFLLFAAALAGGCESDTPLVPETVDMGNGKPDCAQVDLGLVAFRESDRREVNFFDSGEVIVLAAVPLGVGGPLSPSCRYSRTAGWKLPTSDRALTCREYGEDFGLQKIIECRSFVIEADLTVFVQHGGFGRSRTFKVVR